jgi:hypothetical protein
VVVTTVLNVEVLVEVTVAVGVGKDRQLQAVERSEHANVLSGGGAPPQFTTTVVVDDFAGGLLEVVEVGFEVVVVAFDVVVDLVVVTAFRRSCRFAATGPQL